jgi:hypothetical protein
VPTDYSTGQRSRATPTDEDHAIGQAFVEGAHPDRVGSGGEGRWRRPEAFAERM